MITFREVVRLFDTIGNKHHEIHGFHSGFMDEVDINKLGAEDYTLLYVEPSNTTINTGVMTYTFNVYVMDMISDKVGAMENSSGFNTEGEQRLGRIDAFSETLQILHDVINEFKQSINSSSWVDEEIVLQVPVTCEPFNARFNNLLTGWTTSLSIDVNNKNNLCVVPVIPNS